MKILLVEDEKRMAQTLCEILRLEKYEVDYYEDGISGLDAVESNIYDIIILDVMLPGLDGFKIAKKARKKGIRAPILMLTDPDAAAVSMVWSYIGELVFNMLVLVGVVKMADRVVREMMGL
ncbi:DNA-binding response OmpR family regulator [Catenibacillus scindens]|uniref:Stage 0 sporulation protein A homolog n=1 Tax=Catenibacillus scindens TaxID=673271 RepID=A0A7W8M5V7_9FIRM|nr:response regulator [Catenibacillus scindens]MBB5265329.1 DNA-binding response OmpR family regulator [Catenibacillus scindens]